MAPRFGKVGAPVTVSVEVSEWLVKRGENRIDGPLPKDEITRVYHFSGMRLPDTTSATTGTLRILCTLQPKPLIGNLEDGTAQLVVNRRLRFYLWPFRLPHEASFSMWLQTLDRMEGGRFDVLGGTYTERLSTERPRSRA
jgi:hypothetical protein